MRVISLVPSQTELMLDMGLGNRLIGRTKFCIHPREIVDQIPVVGGTKKIRKSAIEALNPDLIVGNKEENTKSDIDWLSSRYPVWISNVHTLEDALAMILDLGTVLDLQSAASIIHRKINAGFAGLHTGKFAAKSAMYLIWMRPVMAVASRTFIHDMLKKAGFENVMAEKERYPEIEEKDIIEINPSVLLLSSEPYPFKSQHQNYFRTLLPETQVVIVDGEMFSWYGSRLTQAPRYFMELRNQLDSLN
jgi:ABC-type Fe3+-hydroxamate transport system substrate-binding protein